MKKGMLIITGIFLGLLLTNFVFAEKLGIEINSVDREGVNFEITLYDDSNNKLDGNVDYLIQDYYTDIVGEGESNSREEIKFKFPKNPKQGPWKITANYRDISVSELFNLGDIERADIRLEGDNLVIENMGNVPYDNNILVYIGESHQTAKVYLSIGQVKKIRLTAPAGEYVVKIDDGSGEKNLIFSGVSLTGNVIGLEDIMDGSFWKKYPLVSIFLIALVAVIVIVGGLKLKKKYLKTSLKTSRKSNKKRK